MGLSLQGRRPEVGRAGMALCRQYPHLACVNFLAELGTPRAWSVGRRRLDAGKALALVFEHLRPSFAGVNALILALPAYVSGQQAALVLSLAKKARLPAVGSVAAPVACALAAHGAARLDGPVVMLDADDHALCLTSLECVAGQIRVMAVTSVPRLSLRLWKEGLLNAIAERCIYQSRRDPRDSGAAEQLLYDQLDDVFEVSGQGQMVEVVIRTALWCQNLILQPEQVRAFTHSLLRQTLEECLAVFEAADNGGPTAILVTAAAGRLPGLVEAFHEQTPAGVAVRVLPADAAAQGAHFLAARFHQRECTGHLDRAAPASAAPAGGDPRQRVIPIASADR
jgi:hypothetical protein